MKIVILALLFAIPAFIPQVLKVYKKNETESFSETSILLYWMSQLCWILHGLSKGDIAIAVAASINISCFSYIIMKKYRNGEIKYIKFAIN